MLQLAVMLTLITAAQLGGPAVPPPLVDWVMVTHDSACYDFADGRMVIAVETIGYSIEEGTVKYSYRPWSGELYFPLGEDDVQGTFDEGAHKILTPNDPVAVQIREDGAVVLWAQLFQNGVMVSQASLFVFYGGGLGD